MGDRKKKYGQMGAARFWFVIWGMGLAGQICWNIENQWFNTFVYAKISGDVNIVTSMVMVSALVTTISTFFFGTLSDRSGKRKRLISTGYIIWGITTILFGMTEYARDSGIGVLVALSGFLVVLTDAVMSFSDPWEMTAVSMPGSTTTLTIPTAVRWALRWRCFRCWGRCLALWWAVAW